MLEIKNIDAQIEKVLQLPTVKADFSKCKCCGRMQLPICNNLFPYASPVVIVDAESDIYHVDFSFGELSEKAEISNQDYYNDAIECINDLISKGIILSVHEIGEGGIVTALLGMNFPNTTGGMKINFKDMGRHTIESILFARNPGVIVQVASKDKQTFAKMMDDAEVYFAKIGYPCDSRWLSIRHDKFVEDYDINALRKVWCPDFKDEPLMLSLGYSFDGKLPKAEGASFIAAVQNGNKQLTKALNATGFDVMELDNNGTNIDDAHLIIYSDLKDEVVNRFLSRKDTLAIQVQPLGTDNPARFIGLSVNENSNIMLRTLAYRKIAIWSNTSKEPAQADGENIVADFMYDKGPAAYSSHDGRHLTLNGILAESMFPRQWGWYPDNRNDEVSPWIELFVNAQEWLKRF